MIKVSALIFSMNRIENVIRLVEKIHNFVDEIVIVDSSSRENHKLLKEKLKFARVYWLPPIGMADLYYQMGINLCKYDWIFQLDDDEEPNYNLLRDLRDLPRRFNAKVFKIKRLEPTGEYSSPVRFFKKTYVEPTGVIHWGYKIKTSDVVELDKKQYLIIHHDEYSGKDLLKKIKKYVVIEAYQWGYKINYTIKHSQRIITKFFRAFFNMIERCNKSFAYWLFANLFIIFYFVDRQFPLNKEKIKRLPFNIFYCLLIFLEINRNFLKYLNVWKSMNDQKPIEWLGLENTRNLVGLSVENGLENFERLVKRKIKNLT